MSDFNENEMENLDEKNDKQLEEVYHKAQKKTLWSDIIDFAEIFAVAICVVIVLFTFVFRTCTVDGDSMNKTLYDGEVLVVSDLLYSPKQGDIIVFHQTGYDNIPLVKRVIGTAGDKITIDFDRWTVSVTHKDGKTEILDEPYVFLDENRKHLLSGTTRTYDIPDGCLLVLGDNRNNSKDSTSVSIGFVDERRVLGKVLFRITPFSKFGSVYNY